MARKLRIQFPDALYLITNRGDRLQPITLDDSDRQAFFQTLEEAVHKTGWRINAITLLPNHFHMLLRTPRENLVEGMKWFLATYTGRFNRRHQSPGHLFAGRYRSQVLDPTQSDLITQAFDYIHLNPMRLKQGALVDEQLAAYAWSSLPDYLNDTRGPQWPWLAREEGLARMGLDQAVDAGEQIRRRIQPVVERGGVDARWEVFRRGWCAGSAPFRQFLLEQLNRQRDDKVSGAAWQEAAALTAEKRVQQLMTESGWSEEWLAQTAKSHPEKIRIAQALREETTMTLQWIAHRLNMGSVYTLRNVLAVHRVALREGRSTSTPSATLDVPSEKRAARAQLHPAPAAAPAPIRADPRAAVTGDSPITGLREPRTLTQTTALVASRADESAESWPLSPRPSSTNEKGFARPDVKNAVVPPPPVAPAPASEVSSNIDAFDPGWD